jgi:hypothetical protein
MHPDPLSHGNCAPEFLFVCVVDAFDSEWFLRFVSGLSLCFHAVNMLPSFRSTVFWSTRVVSLSVGVRSLRGCCQASLNVLIYGACTSTKKLPQVSCVPAVLTLYEHGSQWDCV